MERYGTISWYIEGCKMDESYWERNLRYKAVIQEYIRISIQKNIVAIIDHSALRIFPSVSNESKG